METASQNNNIIKIDTGLGQDVLHLTQFDIAESLSQPFVITVSCYTNGQEISAENVIGKPVNISLFCSGGENSETRFFNGYVEQVTALGSRVPNESNGEKYRDYALTVVPGLSFLSQRRNCRIFQNVSVDKIVSTVLEEHGVNIKNELEKSYPDQEFRVQYHESDFDFIHRLLEESGIFYFFEHGQKTHSVVMADALGAYQKSPEEKVAYTTGTLAENHIYSWNDNLKVTSGSVATRGYDFIKPGNKPVGEKQQSDLAEQQRVTEVFDYYAESELNPRLQHVSALSLESIQNDQLLCRGAGNCLTFSAGQYFSFSDHEDPAQIGCSYLLTQVSLSVTITSQTGAVKSQGQSASNTFECIPADILFRPKKVIKKPHIYGAQTALVTGGDADEIHVDKYGRIKVLFPWDRENKANDGSSCWIRVVQNWAGDRYGSFFLPRVGHEVMVTFLDGDPDQPVVTGCLYNGDNMPPYALPDAKYCTGIKTRSTLKGAKSNFNELRFEDDKGKELLYMQAEKDLQTEVKNCQNDRIGKNLIIDVGKNADLLAGSKIIIKTGAASITMSSSGNIDISGTSISINGTKIALKAAAISLN